MNTERQIACSPCLTVLLENTKPIVCLEGSTRSTKTWSILQYLTDRAMREKVRVFAGRHDGTTCDTTIISDWHEVLATHWPELWDSLEWNKQRKRAVFPDTGSIWEFGGTSDHQKLHGRKQDILWLNEVMEIDYEAWKQLNQRTGLLVIMDWNPSLTQHWVFDRIMKGDQYTYHHSTYEDNAFLEDRVIAAIEAYEPTPANIAAGTADEWHWRVYGLGKRAGKQGRVFKLWETTDHWPAKNLCQRWGYGMDFGYSQDPSTLIECALYRDELYLRQRMYEKELIPGINISQPKEPSIQGRLGELEILDTAPIVADSAEPASIQTLRLGGYNMMASRKGKGSVVEGINLMKQFRVKVHIASQDLQRELENYTWGRKQDGTWLSEPIDDWNHGIDAARYWAMANLEPRVRATLGDGRSRTRRKAKTPLRRY